MADTLRGIANRTYTWLVREGYTEVYAISVTREILHAENQDHAAQLVSQITREHKMEE